MLVSCIMPTKNRRAFLPMALFSYLSQDWPEKELVVVDDGTDPVEDMLQEIPRVKYLSIPAASGFTIGFKRNLACKHADGELIAHFDDDDWSCPTRLSEQAATLLASEKAMTGYNQICFYDQVYKNTYHYQGYDDYAVGTSFLYKKELWERHPFKDVQAGEDTKWLSTPEYTIEDFGGLITADGTQKIVARVHTTNVGSHRCREGFRNWPRVSNSLLPDAFVHAMEELYGADSRPPQH